MCMQYMQVTNHQQMEALVDCSTANVSGRKIFHKRKEIKVSMSLGPLGPATALHPRSVRQWLTLSDPMRTHRARHPDTSSKALLACDPDC